MTEPESGSGSNRKLFRKNAPGNRSDIGWLHGKEVGGDCRKVKCNYCDKIVTSGIYRFKHHLACTKDNVLACPNVPDVVKRQILSNLRTLEDVSKKKQEGTCMRETEDDSSNNVDIGFDVHVGEKRKGKEIGSSSFFEKKTGVVGSKQSTINQMLKKELREEVCMQVAQFFYTSAIPFNCVKNPDFIKICQLIGKYGQGFEPPSYHEIREKYLRKHVDNIMAFIEEHKIAWKKYGCTIISDGWTNKRKRSICNFLVNSPQGTVFLTSLDTSNVSKTADVVFEMLDAIVQQVGEDNVVQVVTDNATNYKLAGEMLMEKRKMLFWTPCAAHCIDLMLEDFEKKNKLHQVTISKGRKITNFIYARTLLISIMKHFTKGRELVRPGATRFATNYICLGCLYDNKNGLRSMFTSNQWAHTKVSKTQDGKKIARTVLDNRFWNSVNECLQAAYHLIKVLRKVDSEGEPAMGFIYDEMDLAKENIKTNLRNERRRYESIWKIIAERWEMQLHRPLHAAAYYLNPQFHYSPKFKADRNISRGLYTVMERILQDIKERDKVDLQLEEFKHARGLFGIPMAKSMRFKKTPTEWWESYGAEVPEAQKFAIRILSLTCSSSGCERNWSAFEMVHTKKRNRLHAKKMKDLVFVMSNIKLNDKKTKKQSYEEDISSSDEWIAATEGEEEEHLLPKKFRFPILTGGHGCGDGNEEDDNDLDDILENQNIENFGLQNYATIDNLDIREDDGDLEPLDLVDDIEVDPYFLDEQDQV